GRRPSREARGDLRRALDVVQPALPVERLFDDGVEVVALRAPAERGADEIGLGDDRGGIAGAPARDIHLEVDARDALDDVDHLADGITASVAAITRKALAAASEIGERGHMRVDEVADLDVVAQAGAVAGRIILAEDVEVLMTPQRRLHRALDE